VIPDRDCRQVLPARAGIGLRNPHVAAVLATRPALPWLEVHPLVSEHLAWSQVDGAYLNHLLPLPYTEESLAVVCRNVDEIQSALGRRVLIENPSGYLRFSSSAIPEPEFMAEIAARTGSGLLCDVNNIHVTAQNLGLDPLAYLSALPRGAVAEIHLAGHSANEADGRTLLIDDHGSPVGPAVWALYERALERFGALPTLVEWDTDIPALDVLLGEARKADILLQRALRDDDAA
jgi:uncharacterized protein